MTTTAEHRAIPADDGPDDICASCGLGIIASPHDGAPIHGTAADPGARVLAYAAERGTADGTNAAGWYTQETVGGRVTVDVRPIAHAILRGIEDGDPAVMDGLPFADLSGEWADTLTGPQLTVDALMAAGYSGAYATEYASSDVDWLTPVCDAYEDAFSAAAESAIVAACKAVLS